jgi:hypothetical protein
MWNDFKARIQRAVAKHVPTKKVKGGGRPAWISKEILAEVKRKRRLWRQCKGGAIPEEYKRMENSLKKKIRRAKRRFEKELADGRENKRRFFTYVKRRTKARQSVGPIKNVAGETIADDKGMADELNKFFSLRCRFNKS